MLATVEFGRIVIRSHVVGCGVCKTAFTETVGSRTTEISAYMARKLGWRKTKQYGWACPACFIDTRGRHLAPLVVRKGGA